MKQEANTASIKDMAKASPALESRCLHDHYWRTAREYPFRSESLRSRKAGRESGPLGKPTQQIEMKLEERVRLPRELAPRGQQLSSLDSDTSVGSELLNEDGEDSAPIVNGAEATTGAVLKPPYDQICQLYTLAQQSGTSCQSAKHPQPPVNGNPGLASNRSEGSQWPPQGLPNGGHHPTGQPVYIPPDFLGKLDELFGRIHQRDHKVNKLRMRNKGLKQKLDQLEDLYREACEKLEASQRQNEELELQLKKFECRLKQAQIVLNDPTDRVDLQLNHLSNSKGQSEEFDDDAGDERPAGRDLASQQPQR